MQPWLARIAIYPIKSLEATVVNHATMTRGAGLAGDREFCIVDEQGRWVNGKRTLLVHRVPAVPGLAERARRDRESVEAWLSQLLEMPVRMERDPEKGFPDDTNAPGPTLISTATLCEAARWFGWDLEEARRRIRANLEIEGAPAFWEDALIRPFSIGDVLFEGTNPCARCVVPSRDSRTGEVTRADFAKAFAELREKHLPPWADRRRFDHYYRMALNTRVPESEAGKVLRIGDPVSL